MAWDKLIVEVPNDSLKEAIVGEFSADSLAGVWERPLEGERSELVLYFGDAALPPLVQARVGRIFERNGYAPPAVATGQEEEVDWTLEWRKGFSSFSVGRRFRIAPSWEDVDPSGSRLVLRIDPGLAFGTGTHETTRLMLEALEAFGDRSTAVLDIGTGSGILAIAARKLGFESVAACDIDAGAASVAAGNARRNRTSVPLFAGSADALPRSRFGLILANLSLDAFAGILPEIRRVLKPGGTGVLSGVLRSQERLLGEALVQEGFRIAGNAASGEWMAVTVTTDGD